jgi:dihydropyrimidinase
LCVHAEDGVAIDYLTARLIAEGKLAPKYHAESRPSEVERDGVVRTVQLLKLIGGASVYIVHISSAAALQVVQAARDEGLGVYGETCPRYLAFTEELYEQPFERAARYVLTPPLRTAADQRALLVGLRSGALAAVSSDHICFLDADKARGRENFALIPNGAPAIETMLSTVYTKAVVPGAIDLSRWVAVMSTLPAKLYGLFPRKGTLSIGGDAGIVVFDPRKRWVVDHIALHSRCDFALDEGMELIGAPVTTISRGQVIWTQGQF